MKFYDFIRKNSKFLFIAWLLVIITASSIPNLPIPKIKIKTGDSHSSNIRLDYFIHFLEYFILSVFFVSWRMNNNSKLKFKKILLYVVLGIGFALLDEIYQKLIPGRTFNIIDCVYDSLGFAAGIFFILLITSVHFGNSSKMQIKKNVFSLFLLTFSFEFATFFGYTFLYWVK